MNLLHHLARGQLGMPLQEGRAAGATNEFIHSQEHSRQICNDMACTQPYTLRRNGTPLWGWHV